MNSFAAMTANVPATVPAARETTNHSKWPMAKNTKMPPCGAFSVTSNAMISAPVTAPPNIIDGMTRSGSAAAKGMAPYCVSKAALAMLTRVSALDLAPRDVRVVAVAPGLVDTPMTRPGVTGVPETLRSMLESVPLGRIGRPQDVAALVCFLASEEASFITGTTVSADGGMGLRGYPDRPGVPPPTAR